jgi:hypothetical protein
MRMHSRRTSGTARTEIERGRLEDLPELLKVSEVQEYLGIGRGLAYELARWHGVRLGRLVRVPRYTLANLLKLGPDVQAAHGGTQENQTRSGKRLQTARPRRPKPLAKSRVR